LRARAFAVEAAMGLGFTVARFVFVAVVVEAFAPLRFLVVA